MFISQLDVVNECLGLMGEAPLNSLDEEHAFTASALRALRIANVREQAKGWWFNRETVTLAPQSDTGHIYVPEDTISVDPVSQWTHLVQRGRRLYDPLGRGYAIGQGITVTLIRAVPFEELPSLAQSYISICTQIDFQKQYDADRAKASLITDAKAEAYAFLRAEDVRNAGVNLLYKPSTLAKLARLGGRIRNDGLATRAYPNVSTNTVSVGGEPVDQDVPNFSDIFTETADGT